MQCKNCEHECHCGNNGQCAICKCSNCEHNALDEFWKRNAEDKKLHEPHKD